MQPSGWMTMTTTRSIALAGLLICASPPAFAADGSDWPEEQLPPATAPPQPDAPPPDRAGHENDSFTTAFERPFAYIPDPSTPGAWRIAAGYTASYATTEGAARPLAALSQRSGLVNELSAELGLHPRLSVLGAVAWSPPRDTESSGRAAGRGVLRGEVTNPGLQNPFHLTLGAGFLRDFAEDSGPLFEASGTFDVDRVRIGGLVHGEKILGNEARDEVDLYAATGVSVRAVDTFRVGAEYVGQDFEDAWEDEEAEGGVRHFAGLTLAFQYQRLYLVGGPAFGLNQTAPRLVGRVAVTYLF